MNIMYNEIFPVISNFFVEHCYFNCSNYVLVLGRQIAAGVVKDFWIFDDGCKDAPSLANVAAKGLEGLNGAKIKEFEIFVDDGYGKNAATIIPRGQLDYLLSMEAKIGCMNDTEDGEDLATTK